MTEKTVHQADVISCALLSGKLVDSVTAGTDYGIWRLSSIIHRLRRKGWPIITERDAHNGLARYSLEHRKPNQ